MPNCVCGCPPAVGLPFLGGWWHDLHSGNRKTLHSAKPTNGRESEKPTLWEYLLCCSPWQGISLDDQIWEKPSRPPFLDDGGEKSGGKPPGSDCGGVWQSGAEVSSTRRCSPWVNLRRSLRVGAWNVLSLREDDHLSLIRAPAFEHWYCSTLRFGDRIVARSW